MKKTLLSIVASSVMLTASMSANALTWEQANKVPASLAQAEYVSTHGCKSFKTPGMNQTVKNIRIWMKAQNNPVSTETYNHHKKQQKRDMGTISWNEEKCANWDSQFVPLADMLAGLGYGDTVARVVKDVELTTGQKYGYMNILSDFCGIGAYEAMSYVSMESDYNAGDVGLYNNEAYSDMKKMGKGKFCKDFAYLADIRTTLNPAK